MLESLDTTDLLLAGGGTTAAAYSDSVTAGGARFRVDHFSPNAPPVDVYVNGDPLPGLQGVPLGTLSDYSTIPVGTYQVEVTPADDTSTVVIDAGVVSRRNHGYTVAATDTLDAITPAALVDMNCPASYDRVSVRIMHFSPDAPEVDIIVKDGLALFSGLTLGGISQYGTVPAGTYDLQVVLSSNEAIVPDSPGTILPGGWIISAPAIGFITGGLSDFSALPTMDAASSARESKPPSDDDVYRVG